MACWTETFGDIASRRHRIGTAHVMHVITIVEPQGCAHCIGHGCAEGLDRP